VSIVVPCYGTDCDHDSDQGDQTQLNISQQSHIKVTHDLEKVISCHLL